MEKKEFSFYQDVKVTVWVRQHFTMEAESKEEALEMVEEYKKNDIGTSDDSINIVDTEWMMDTWEPLTPEENGYYSTIELYDAETKKMIGDNASHFFTGKEEETRKLIGYQIAFENNVWPMDLYSFQVFRAEEDAQDYLWGSQLKGEIVPIYEGDVEEPAFIGKKPRMFKKDEEVCVVDDTDTPSYGFIVRDEETEYDEDEVAVKLHTANAELYVMAQDVYQKADGKVCPRCGSSLYIEHHDEIDYPYYCPDCQENFYNIEVQ